MLSHIRLVLSGTKSLETRLLKTDALYVYKILINYANSGSCFSVTGTNKKLSYRRETARQLRIYT